MSEPIQLMVTQAGLAALVTASGTAPIEIVAVGLTASGFVMAPTITNLPGEFDRIDAVSGTQVSPTVIHMTAQDPSEAIYELRGIGLYLADGTLFAVYSQATPIFRKVSIATFLLALDVTFTSGAVDNISFGDTSFLLPPASETMKGVAEIADNAEADQGTDDSRIMSPLKVRRVLDALHLLLSAEIDGDIADLAAEIEADMTALAAGFDALLAALIARTITGAGLVTGGGNLSASRVLQVLAANAADVAAGTATDRAVTPAALSGLTDRTITGAGLMTGGGNLTANRVLQVLAASAADVAAGIAADRAVTPAALSGLTDRTITGAGLVTGGGNLTASRVLQVLAASAADVATGTATDRAITPSSLSGLARSLGENGYVTLPGCGGLILQWGRFTAISNGVTNTLFPIAFPTACFTVAEAGGVNGGADSQDNPPVLVTSGITTSGFAVFSADDSAAGCAYIALGI